MPKRSPSTPPVADASLATVAHELLRIERRLRETEEKMSSALARIPA